MFGVRNMKGEGLQYMMMITVGVYTTGRRKNIQRIKWHVLYLYIYVLSSACQHYSVALRSLRGNACQARRTCLDDTHRGTDTHVAHQTHSTNMQSNHKQKQLIYEHGNMRMLIARQCQRIQQNVEEKGVISNRCCEMMMNLYDNLNVECRLQIRRLNESTDFSDKCILIIPGFTFFFGLMVLILIQICL